MGKMNIKLIMPSEGDMELIKQDGGVLVMKPTYYGGECAGPVIQFLDEQDQKKVVSSYRIKIKSSGELRLAKAEQ